MPACPDAPLSELLDVKAELKGPVDRYRSAVVRLERDLPQEAIDAELDVEIEAIWRKDVAPALVELEQLLIEHRFVREMTRSIGRSAKDLVLAGSALTLR